MPCGAGHQPADGRPSFDQFLAAALRGRVPRDRPADPVRSRGGGGRHDGRQAGGLRRPRGDRAVLRPGGRDRHLHLRHDVRGAHQPGCDRVPRGDRPIPMARGRAVRRRAAGRVGLRGPAARGHLRTDRRGPRQRRRGGVRRRRALPAGHPRRGGSHLPPAVGDHGYGGRPARPRRLGRTDHRAVRDGAGRGLRPVDGGRGQPGPRAGSQRRRQPVRRLGRLEPVPRIRDRFAARGCGGRAELRPDRAARDAERELDEPAQGTQGDIVGSQR